MVSSKYFIILLKILIRNYYFLAKKCCTPDGKYEWDVDDFCFPVKVPLNDKTMGAAGISCMNFTRTITDRDLGCTFENKPAKQVNEMIHIFF